jgi:hypothetical protein
MERKVEWGGVDRTFFDFRFSIFELKSKGFIIFVERKGDAEERRPSAEWNALCAIVSRHWRAGLTSAVAPRQTEVQGLLSILDKWNSKAVSFPVKRWGIGKRGLASLGRFWRSLLSISPDFGF